MSTNTERVDAFEASLQIAWQFDYDVDIDKLRNLYSKAKRCQWNAEEDVDWSVPIDPSRPIVDESQFVFSRLPLWQRISASQREGFRAHMSAHMLSQFLHGEQGALMTSAALTHAVPDHEGKLYAATQTMDEARHVEVYEGYIRRLAILYPMSPWLKDLIDLTLRSGHWVKIAIGMNMVVEGLALGSFHNTRRNSQCDLLRQITNLVLRDESRHVAFGNVYVGAAISDLHADDREDVAEFAFQVVKLMTDALGGPHGRGRRRPDPGFRRVLEEAGIDIKDFAAELAELGASGVRGAMQPGQVHSFKDLMMPALVRVGAVTDRTRELYAAAEIPVWEDASTLEALEDGATGAVELAPVS